MSFPGDPALRHALLDEQDISPDCPGNIFLQTDDQNFELTLAGNSGPNFQQLELPFCDDDYMFSLGQGEGISDLFDVSDFHI